MTAWRRAPLWLRLVTSLLLLAALALLISGFVGLRLLRGYLVGEVDKDLADVVENPRQELFPDGTTAQVPTPYYLVLLDTEGNVVREIEPLLYDQPAPDVSGFSYDDATDRNGRPFTVDAISGHGHWRALAIPQESDRTTVVIATSLDDVDATVGRLGSIDIFVGLCVLAGLGLAGYGMVRGSLRRLVEIEQTAGSIARGDLSQRVVDADPATEVGRLGQALNLMLDQIESAFRGSEASEARAIRSEARMRQFVADASHELRTPLTSIRGFAELYRHGAADPSATGDLLGRIEDEATRMGLLVDDLLLLARLDQQRPLAQAPVDLVALARDASDAARVVAKDRKIELVSPVDSLLVIGDETRLRHVVSNLVDNALTHTPAGTPVEVDVRRQEHDGHDWAALEVRDHGLGLTPDQAARVFERFYRTDAARSRPGGGSGLGLSIVAAIASAHGGRAEVDTAPGDGSTFRVLLPLPQDDDTDEADAGAGDDAPLPNLPPFVGP